MKRKGLLLLGGLAGIGTVAVARSSFAEKYEQPAYTVLQRSGDFELRRYEPMLVAETVVNGDYNSALNEGFRRLAGFIFGENVQADEIAMTAPVTAQPAAEKIEMTIPVGARREGEAWVISFVMPSEYTARTLPRPKDPRVTIRQQPARTVAVKEFSWFATEGRMQEHLRQLHDDIAERGLISSGAPIFAQYNAPLTLPFMRRNEVLLPVQPAAT